MYLIILNRQSEKLACNLCKKKKTFFYDSRVEYKQTSKIYFFYKVNENNRKRGFELKLKFKENDD